MKKAIILLAIGFSFVYCNPSQQAEQTTTDSGRMTDSSASSSSMSPSTDTSAMPSSDTTKHPDSTRIQ